MQTIRVDYKSTGDGKLTTTSPVYQVIVAYYLDGRVRTRTGDVWACRKYGGDEADLIALPN